MHKLMASYRDVLLSQNLLPVICSIAGETVTFQQDSAPAHRARDTVEYLSRHAALAFIPQWIRPPNSSDLNPVDYESGACCRDESTVPGSAVSTALSIVLSNSGITSKTESPRVP